jgi:transcriptional regulator with XRE-family HTH domain
MPLFDGELTMRELDPQIGRQLRVIRERRGMTQLGLARLCGVSRRHLAAIERGQNSRWAA